MFNYAHQLVAYLLISCWESRVHWFLQLFQLPVAAENKVNDSSETEPEQYI